MESELRTMTTAENDGRQTVPDGPASSRLRIRFSRSCASLALPGAVLLFLGGVYWETFARSLTSGTHGDPAALMTAAIDFKVAHTNSYPTYLCFLRFLYWLFPTEVFVSLANGSSAVFALAALGMAYAFFRLAGVSRVVAASAILFIGLRSVFWSQSLFAEVYQLTNMLFLAGLLALFWLQRSRRLSAAAAAGLLCGLQLTNHLLAAGAAGLTGVVCLFTIFRSGRRRWIAAGLLVLCGILGLLPYLYLPLSWHDRGLSLQEGIAALHWGGGDSPVYPPEYGKVAEWTAATDILVDDLGVLGMFASLAGIFLLATGKTRDRRIGFIVGLGGVAVPVLYLMHQRPWELAEILAFYLFPLFCLCLFIPFAMEAGAARIGSWLGGSRRANLAGVTVVSASFVVASWVSLVDGYPKWKQRNGELRYRAAARTLGRVPPKSNVLSYSIFGGYYFANLLAVLMDKEGDVEWRSFTEKAHRPAAGDRPMLEDFLAECDRQRKPFWVLTDSASAVVPKLQAKGYSITPSAHLEFCHEVPEIEISPDGTASLRPRDWLEFLSGSVVWELDAAFIGGHAFHNFAVDWSWAPQKRIEGRLVCGNEFASKRFRRQKVYTLQAAFEKAAIGGRGPKERMWLEMDPVHMFRPPQIWLYKERNTVPYSLDIAEAMRSPGEYQLSKMAFFPLSESDTDVNPVRHALFRVWK